MVEVSWETPRHDAVARLLAQSDAAAALLYPNEFRRRLDPIALDADHIRLLVARCEGAAAGCCALFLFEDYPELKRMIVDEAFRQRGVARALLRSAVETARNLGYRTLKLEVGVRNLEAERLYRTSGFRDCAPFGAYKPSPVSTFLELDLGAA